MASYIYPQPEDRVGRAGGDWAFALRAVAHFPRFCFEIRATSREGKKNNGCEDNDTWQLEPCQIKSDQRKKRKNFLSTEVDNFRECREEAEMRRALMYRYLLLAVGGWRLAAGQAGKLAIWQFATISGHKIIQAETTSGPNNMTYHCRRLHGAWYLRDAGQLGPTRLGPEVVRVFVVVASETYAGCPFLFRSAPSRGSPVCACGESVGEAPPLLPGRASLSLFSIASKPHLQL
ncbi:uncharacterized protein BDCG_16833 [Blastomyces dermatitidis ER-3]|nr:uncharacterized protein BDCG_16833 [Blastomyces dermatitidis ER-3]EQL32756.1 hypothetical protein BDFG_05143 [Blastomyces dermatitidis ATCC 26199]OAT01000.1 hypothetical protein BDCG_16833 [Blastomyces dermatitidis ER-3]